MTHANLSNSTVGTQTYHQSGYSLARYHHCDHGTDRKRMERSLHGGAGLGEVKISLDPPGS